MRTVLLGCALLLSTSAHATNLSYGAGTFQLGGTATANLWLDNGNLDSWIALAPSGGIFIADRWELMGAVSFTFDNNGQSSGFAVGPRYVTGLGQNDAYLGGLVGFGTGRVLNIDIGGASGTVMGGFLFGLNEHVAVDVGARVNMYFNNNNNTDVVHIPLGYFGIDAFFN